MRNIAPDTARLDVVAAIVRATDGRVLLSQRPLDKHQGGRWEFPGGKVEPAESLEEALARELHEELGIEVQQCRPFMTIEHDYPDLCVRLHFREVTAWSGEPHGREGQPVQWFRPDALDELEFPEANRPVTRALALRDCWAVLPPDHDDWREIIPRLPERGIGGLYLRGAAPEDVAAMVPLCHEHGLLALVRDDVELAKTVGADGVHFSSAALARGDAEYGLAALRGGQPPVLVTPSPGSPPERRRQIVSVACHDATALGHAVALGVDMAMLSPVRATQTHPHAQPLGWTRFQEMAGGLPLAVYALGGVSPVDLDQARRHGARGVAGIRAFWTG